MLLSVDERFTAKIAELSENPQFLENAVDAMYRAIKGGKRSVSMAAAQQAASQSRWKVHSGNHSGRGSKNRDTGKS